MINVTSKLENNNLFILTTIQKIESSNVIAINANDYWFFHRMDETEAINVLKRYSDKKTESVIKLPVLLSSVVIWSYLAHYWSGLNYTCKANYEMELDKYIVITFPLQRHVVFLKDLFFMLISFLLVTICILVSLLRNRSIHYN